MDAVSRGSGREGSELAYFVDDIHDCGGILPLEFQCDVPVLLVIDKRCYLLAIDGSGIPRVEGPPS